jgi:hypothetical protein
MPMCTVEHVRLTRCWASRNIRSFDFVVSSAFRLAGLRNPVFGMCHFSIVLKQFFILLRRQNPVLVDHRN